MSAASGRGWQTRVNALLRGAVQADLMAGLVRDQRIKPIKRISQRQE